MSGPEGGDGHLTPARMAELRPGEYGLCARCGSPIPLGRLPVVPEAAECGACG